MRFDVGDDEVGVGLALLGAKGLAGVVPEAVIPEFVKLAIALANLIELPTRDLDEIAA